MFGWRQQQLQKLRDDPALFYGALEFYAKNPVAFINHWLDTYDPRKAGSGKLAYMPFIMFPRQAELTDFLHAMVKGQANGLVEKSRDMGATWLSCAFSIWLWRFWPGAAIGWGSRKEALVDKIGDADSIFEKMRLLIGRMPPDFLPLGFNPSRHMSWMKIVNPENGSSITGEAGDNIGRGGRKLIYFKDESAHYERPDKIEAALSANTNVQIDISSVQGLGNVFQRRREAGADWDGKTVHHDRANIFVMDWSDHPEKDAHWYARERRRFENDGLLHIFAQEVDRDYASAVEGIIIPAAWVALAIDAHKKLNLDDPSGAVIAGLDVADEGGDGNALAIAQGHMLRSIDTWQQGDTGQTTRRAISGVSPYGNAVIQYDSVGVGAGVKAEANRLKISGELPDGLRFEPWSAGAKVQFPEKHVIPEDRKSPLNKDFYANLKAQAWWELRRRFEKTARAVADGVEFPPDELISIPSELPHLSQLKKELSQPTASQSAGTLKLKVDKKPDGTRSPNLADAVVMAYWPIVPPRPPVMLMRRKR